MKLAALLISTGLAFGQQTDQKTAPIYNVTVIERTIKAVNYQYRSGPTPIDFRGTVLLPEAKGDAIVESRQGRTEIEAHFNRLTQPQRFGREYLTYVLWAISPEGRPHNLGEVVPSGSDKASLRVTTDLQAFAMIVTAEPYSAVRQPSDVVVLENQVREDTAGSTESVNAKYELLPRGQYTWRVSDSLSSELANLPKISAKEADALLELYQAENAVGIAAAANADKYAPSTFARAKQLLTEAQQFQARKAETRLVVQDAREAAQTAEDAQLIARQRQQEEDLRATKTDLSRAQAEVANAQQTAQYAIEAKQRAEAELQQAQAQVQAAQAQAAAVQQQADAERAARAQADAQAAAVANAAANAQAAAAAARRQQEQAAARTAALRIGLLEDMNRVLPARDTTRGLVVTVAENGFNGETLRPTASAQVTRIAAILDSHPGLNIRVEGYSDRSVGLSQRRAELVRATLLNNGLPPTAVSATGLGDSNPLASRNTPQGREENSRVEIVISGDPIGTRPFWDHTYSLTGSR
jgi:outer membrane protein OmpA-like peptidoglycan-associated protein